MVAFVVVCAAAWLLVAIVLGVALGAVIGRADRQRRVDAARISRQAEIVLCEMVLR